MCNLKITQLTTGDLHANALKLIYILLRSGICETTEEKYIQLDECYYHNILTLDDRIKFDALIKEHLKVNPNSILVRLIGDELSDRGQNDYFILKILEKLCNEMVRVEILFSNHGANFILAHELYEQHQNQLISTTIIPIQSSSLSNLNNCLRSNYIDFKTIDYLTKNYYLPNIKLIGASLDLPNNSITLYSHAPIGLLQIQWAAQYFNIPYKESTLLELADVIESINQQFSSLIQNNKLATIFTQESGTRVDLNKALPEDVFMFIAWNRCLSSLIRPETNSGYHLNFVHGHDPQKSPYPHIINLDNTLGKGGNETLGRLETLLSDEIQLIDWQLSHLFNDDDESDEPTSQLSSNPETPLKRCSLPLKRHSESELNSPPPTHKSRREVASKGRSGFFSNNSLKQEPDENPTLNDFNDGSCAL